MAELSDPLSSAIAELEDDKVLALVAERLDAGTPAMEVVGALQVGMKEVGDRFAAGEYFLNELVVAGEIMREAMDLLEPHLKGQAVESKGVVVIGTVKGDIHDLGKNIVVMMLKGAGYDVVDLGVDVPAERFLAAIEESNPHVVGMSALLTQSQAAMKDTIAKIRAMGRSIPIMIGGSYINETIKEQVGADYFGTIAGDAVKIADEVVAERAA
jgi:5-methyltetrahydrofolate--homocysteine methyltransferase